MQLRKTMGGKPCEESIHLHLEWWNNDLVLDVQRFRIPLAEAGKSLIDCRNDHKAKLIAYDSIILEILSIVTKK